MNLPPAAEAAQVIAEAQAAAIEGDSFPEPPGGLPALRSIEGVQALGYLVKSTTVRDCFGPDGRSRSR